MDLGLNFAFQISWGSSKLNYVESADISRR